jgi:hypothetical protein
MELQANPACQNFKFLPFQLLQANLASQKFFFFTIRAIVISAD